MSTTEFDSLLLNSSDFLFPYAIKLTKSLDSGKDLYQETLCKALANREKYSSGTNIKAWLYTIMRNTFINSYRRQYKQAMHIQYGLDYVEAPVEKDVQLYVKDIQKAVANLPVMIRSPFVLYCEGYKYMEIATMLREPLGTIKSKIFVARRMLRTWVTKY